MRCLKMVHMFSCASSFNANIINLNVKYLNEMFDSADFLMMTPLHCNISTTLYNK